MANQSENKEVKILGGGELGTYQSVISSSDSLRLWFQPVLSGETDEDTMETVKDRVRLDITFIPFQGDPVSYGNSRQIMPSALNNKFQKEISIESRVDQGLIGGAIIRAGDVVIDGSVRGKLNKLAETLVSV